MDLGLRINIKQLYFFKMQLNNITDIWSKFVWNFLEFLKFIYLFIFWGVGVGWGCCYFLFLLF